MGWGGRRGHCRGRASGGCPKVGESRLAAGNKQCENSAKAPKIPRVSGSGLAIKQKGMIHYAVRSVLGEEKGTEATHGWRPVGERWVGHGDEAGPIHFGQFHDDYLALHNRGAQDQGRAAAVFVGMHNKVAPKASSTSDCRGTPPSDTTWDLRKMGLRLMAFSSILQAVPEEISRLLAKARWCAPTLTCCSPPSSACCRSCRAPVRAVSR